MTLLLLIRCMCVIVTYGIDSAVIKKEPRYAIISKVGYVLRSVHLMPSLYTGTQSAVKCAAGLSL